jgi:hypothetical protein
VIVIVSLSLSLSLSLPPSKGRKIEAMWYDGVTDYFVAEPKALEEARLKEWDDWLEGESSSDDE